MFCLRALRTALVRTPLRPLLGLVFALAFVASGALRALEAAYVPGDDDMCVAMGGKALPGGEHGHNHQCCDDCLSPGAVPLPGHAGVLLAPRLHRLGRRERLPRAAHVARRRAGTTRSRAPPAPRATRPLATPM